MHRPPDDRGHEIVTAERERREKTSRSRCGVYHHYRRPPSSNGSPGCSQRKKDREPEQRGTLTTRKVERVHEPVCSVFIRAARSTLLGGEKQPGPATALEPTRPLKTDGVAPRPDQPAFPEHCAITANPPCFSEV